MVALAEAPVGSLRWRKAIAGLAWAVGILAVALFAVLVYFRLRYYGHFAPLVFDDAYFFVRYAEIFRQSGVFGWNVGEGAVYGNTSQLYQLLVAGVYWLLHGNVVLTLTLSSMLGAIAYVVALPLAYLAASASRDPALRRIGCALAVVFAAFDLQLDYVTATGMETSWAMAMVALLLAAALRLRGGEGGRRRIVLAGAMVALVYATRPDAALVALAGPAGVALLARDRAQRRAAMLASLLGLASIAAFIALCWLYYGDPLPLAFLVKTRWLSELPTADYQSFIGTPGSYAYVVVLFHMPELVLFAAALFLLRRMPSALQGALVGAVLFCVYHYAAVLPIMGAFGRFYAPAMPVVVLAALLAAEMIVERSGILAGLGRIDLRGAALLAALGLLLLVKIFVPIRSDAVEFQNAVAEDDGRNTAQGAFHHAAQVFYFFNDGRATLRGLGDGLLATNCVVASTEDGLISAYVKGLPVVDISGLHDRDVVHRGFSADRLLLERRPDVLVMPHPFYTDWIKAIIAHPALARDYVMDPPPNGTHISIGFRRDSPCAGRVRAMMYSR